MVSLRISFLSVVQSRISVLALFVLQIIQSTVSGCCDFLAQCVLVRINHCTYHPFNHLNLQRSTDVGSSGAKISV